MRRAGVLLGLEVSRLSNGVRRILGGAEDGRGGAVGAALVLGRPWAGARQEEEGKEAMHGGLWATLACGCRVWALTTTREPMPLWVYQRLAPGELRPVPYTVWDRFRHGQVSLDPGADGYVWAAEVVPALKSRRVIAVALSSSRSW